MAGLKEKAGVQSALLAEKQEEADQALKAITAAMEVSLCSLNSTICYPYTLHLIDIPECSYLSIHAISHSMELPTKGKGVKANHG